MISPIDVIAQHLWVTLMSSLGLGVLVLLVFDIVVLEPRRHAWHGADDRTQEFSRSAGAMSRYVPMTDMTDEQLRDYEKFLYDCDDVWAEREQVLREINRREVFG